MLDSTFLVFGSDLLDSVFWVLFGVLVEVLFDSFVFPSFPPIFSANVTLKDGQARTARPASKGLVHPTYMRYQRRRLVRGVGLVNGKSESIARYTRTRTIAYMHAHAHTAMF